MSPPIRYFPADYPAISEGSLKHAQTACKETEEKIKQLAEEEERLRKQKKSIGKETTPSADSWATNIFSLPGKTIEYLLQKK